MTSVIFLSILMTFLFTCNNYAFVQHLITLLSSEFELRDLGNAYYFLGIEVSPTSTGLMLSQHKYDLDIIHRVGMSSCKSIDTLFSTSKIGL
jgi:hypothetical protein